MALRLLLALALANACAVGLRAGEPVSALPAVSRGESPSIEAALRTPVISAIALSPDGTILATAGDDHLVRLFGAKDGRLLHVLRGHRDWVRTLAFGPDGRWLVSAGDDGQPLLWQVESGALVDRLATFAAAIYSSSLSPDGTRLAVAGFRGAIDIHDLATGQPARTIATDCGELRSVVFSADGRLLIAGGRPAMFAVFDLASGKAVAGRTTSLKRIRAIACSPDDRQLAIVGDTPTIEIWSTHDWQLVRRIESPVGSIRAAVFCAHELLATGGTDNRVLLWNIATDGPPRSLNGHTGSISALAFDAANSKLISGGYDTRIRLWNVESRSEQAHQNKTRLR